MKTISKLLIIVLIIGSLSTSIFSATIQFSDVKSGDWFYSNVTDLANKGIVNGFSDGTFKPSQQLTFDQWIKLLVSTKNNNISNSQSYWAKNFINEAFKLGILDQTYPKTIDSKNYGIAINRYETTKLAMTLISQDTIPSNWAEYTADIADYNLIPEKYKESVAKAYAIGIMTGYPDDAFKGENILTRAESSAIISRVLYPSLRFKPLTPAERLLKLELEEEIEANIFTNLMNVTIEEDDIIFENSNGSYSLSGTSLSPSQKSFAELIFTLWNDEIINNSQSGFMSTTINSHSFNMNYSVVDISTKDISLNITDNNMITLKLIDSLDLSNPTSVRLLELFSQAYDNANKDQLYDLIIDQFNISKNDITYNNQLIFGSSTVNISKNEEFVSISFVQN